MRRYRTMIWGWVLGAAIVACRSHEPFCGFPECADTGGGSGGEASGEGSPGGADGGQAGAAPGLEICASDRDCDNGSDCDGEESCVDGTCAPGEPLVCPFDSMRCDDAAPGHCVFEISSPWLIYGTGPTLEALPTRAIGLSPPIVLATQSSQRAPGFGVGPFSTRGDLALTVFADEEFLGRWQYLRLGSGLPESLRDFPDVPSLTSSFQWPWLSSDSSYVLLLDDVWGAFFAPLSDSKAETLNVPLAELDIFEAGPCQAAPSFWYVERESGASGIATPERNGLQLRPTRGVGTPAYSSDQRFVVQTLPEDESSEPSAPGVVVSSCAAEGPETVFEEASAPLVDPTSQSLLLRYPDGSRKLFSLDAPEEQRALWSSEGAVLDDAAFSADGRCIVGFIEEAPHVACVGDAPELVPLGLPKGSRLGTAWVKKRDYTPTVGDAALLALLPDEGSGSALVWQSLTPGLPFEPLLTVKETSVSSLKLSDGDVNEVFIVTALDGTRQKLSRVRLDTPRPELEALLTLDGKIGDVLRAPDGTGLLISLATRELTQAGWWLPLSANEEPGEPLLLSANLLGASFQPVP